MNPDTRHVKPKRDRIMIKVEPMVEVGCSSAVSRFETRVRRPSRPIRHYMSELARRSRRRHGSAGRDSQLRAARHDRISHRRVHRVVAISVGVDTPGERSIWGIQPQVLACLRLRAGVKLLALVLVDG